MPPPSVSPPTPVVEMIPDGVARPCSAVFASTWPPVAPPPTRTLSEAGSTKTSSMPARSMTTPSSTTPSPPPLWPPPPHPTRAPRGRRGGGARERDRASDVLGARAAHDQRRTAVDHAVVDGAGVVVAAIGG